MLKNSCTEAFLSVLCTFRKLKLPILYWYMSQTVHCAYEDIELICVCVPTSFFSFHDYWPAMQMVFVCVSFSKDYIAQLGFCYYFWPIC